MKILIIMLGRIGDMILSTPIYSSIKKKFPDSELTVIAGRRNNIIIKNNPSVDVVYTYDKSPIRIINLFLKIWKKKYDYYIDPKDHHSTESMLFANFVHSPVKIGYNPPGKRYFDISIPSDIENKGLHAILRFFNSTAHLGITIDKPQIPELFIDNKSNDKVFRFIEKIKQPYCLINISTGNLNRKLNVKKWIEIIEKTDFRNLKPIISFAPEDRAVAESILRKHQIVTLFRSSSINDIIALSQNAKLIITCDTSIVHIASAFDVPIFALYDNNEENYLKFAPLSSVQNLIRSGTGLINDIDDEKIIVSLNNFIKVIE